MSNKSGNEMRMIRHKRLRKHLHGTADRPRLAVFRSLRNISVQLIDDDRGNTICSATSLEESVNAGGNKQGAREVGKLIAQRAKEKGITKVVFDRGGYKYTGRVASLADAARENGLEF